MVSKSQLKLITSLQQKKYRDINGLFVAEGPKVISELIHEGLELEFFFGQVLKDEILHLGAEAAAKYELVTGAELQKMSALKTANSMLAVFKKPQFAAPNVTGVVVALDAIRDPGNLGTIIRLCDWFDVSELICSMDTVDCYNPKVVQATMGSLARVPIRYLNLTDHLKQNELPVYGGMMQGSSVYQTKMPEPAIIVLGNEANGISVDVQEQLDHAISIPQFGTNKKTESLNVATATAILLSEFKRTTGK